jgi:hypothetical protein
MDLAIAALALSGSEAGPEDLALLGELEGPEPPGPTMMGREMRALMLSGQGKAGVAKFKVRFLWLYHWKIGESNRCVNGLEMGWIYRVGMKSK